MASRDLKLIAWVAILRPCSTKLTSSRLFGGTGVGKSTFANDASGGHLAVGRDLHACTKVVTQSPEFEVDGQRVVLIDTPGFDDNDVSDVGTLKEIAAFMSESYGAGQRLTGIIYLHRISDNRMGGSSARTFNLFRRMCGTDSLKNVVIATNMWSMPPTEMENRRQDQLQNEFFKPALDERARLVRRATPGRESAHEIIRKLVGQQARPTRIQEEMVDLRKPLVGTEVGKELEMQLADRVERQQREINDVREEIRAEIQERGRAAVAALEKYEREKEEDITRLQESIRVLRAGLESEREMYRRRLREEQEAFDREQDARKRRRNGFRDRVKGFFGKGSK
ncbi:50S ribosome-binding GTPase [Ceratobasidium sp. AG-Ba]|nr:50S ribosome-binding GTPase [Ceratobasidium sp. AG-Ba]